MKEPLSRGTSPRGTALTAGHYIGFTDDLVGRIMDHAEGKGARFTQVCVERGINWALARTWEGPEINRTFERWLKNRKEAPALCPICSGEAAMNRAREINRAA